MSAGSVGRALLTAGVAIGVLPVVSAGAAYACSCVQTDERQQYEQATHVFKGTVLAAQGAAAPEGGVPEGGVSEEPVLYTFDVISTYKGRVTDPQKVTTPGSSAACGVDLEDDGPYLVFASRRDGELTMNLCGGTRPIGENDEPTFGRAAPEPADQGDQGDPAAQEPKGPAPAEPAPTEPVEPAEPAQPAERQGLTATLINKLRGLADGLGGLVPQNPPPGA